MQRGDHGGTEKWGAKRAKPQKECPTPQKSEVLSQINQGKNEGAERQSLEGIIG